MTIKAFRIVKLVFEMLAIARRITFRTALDLLDPAKAEATLERESQRLDSLRNKGDK